MKKVILIHFGDIISIENLLEAWEEFIKGKRQKQDVQEFQLNLMTNILELHQDLANHSYQHGGYQAFNISDPKPRNIHKASVRDRLLHRAVYRILYPYFDRVFISDSYSCRLNKGTHRASNRFREFAYRVSHNNTRTAWVLKCDIKKFFASIDQKILMEILNNYIEDQNIIWLLRQVINSFESSRSGLGDSSRPDLLMRPSNLKGLPLGNLTSQLLVNIYMNEFDQFIKHKLKVKHYIRYADDFVILSHNKVWLGNLLTSQVERFLWQRLRLQLHPSKVSISTVASGVDLLGWVHFSDHRVLRTVTKRRMFKRLSKTSKTETFPSYLGLISHGNSKKLIDKLGNY